MDNEQTLHSNDRTKNSGPSTATRAPAPDPAGEAASRTRKSNSEPSETGAGPRDRLAQHDAQIGRLAAELARQKEDFQNTQVSLVARIADVDDDRRHDTVRLHRSWQTQREELEKRLRRQGTALTLTLLLFALLVATGLGLFYTRFDTTRQTLVQDVATLRQAVDEIQIPDAPTMDQVAEIDRVTQDKLSQLSAAFQSISATLERMERERRAELEAALAAERAKASAATVVETPQEPTRLEPPERDSAASPPQDRGRAHLQEAVPGPEIPSDSSSAPGDALSPAPTHAGAARERSAPLTPEPRLADQDTSTQRPGSTTSAGGNGQDSSTSPKQIKVGDKPYTLQLMGFFSMDSLRRFVARFELPTRLYYQEETYQDRPWFVLIHSLHASREEATDAVSRLPAPLAELDIWIRELDPDQTLTLFHKEPD